MEQAIFGKRVLIIDDDPETLMMTGYRLESWGFETLKAESGEKGLQLAKDEKPDVILLDILMPQMKGWEMCDRLKADHATRHIPVIFVTALGLAVHTKAALALGAEDYLVKPYEPEELWDRMEVCLKRHPHAA